MISPEISVIIPCFQAGKYLEECLLCLFAQTFPAAQTEIIVVNDGSGDGTARILGKFSERLRIFTHAENLGQPAALQTGRENAKGRFLLFFDADDLMPADFLQKMHRRAVSGNADAVFSDYDKFTVSEGRKKVLFTSENQLSERPEIDFLHRFWRPRHSFLFRKKFLEKIPVFSPDLPVFNDVKFYWDVARAGAVFSRCSGVCAGYRSGENALSLGKGLSAYFHEKFKCIELIFSELPDNFAESDSELSAGFIEAYRECNRFFATEKPELSALCCRRILSLQPGYIPPGFWPIRLLSRLFGYPVAEKIAGRMRKFAKVLNLRF